MKMKTKVLLVLLFLITLIVVASNVYWIYLNQKTPYFDAAGHTILTYIYSRIISGEYQFNGLQAFLSQSNYYPPMLYWLGSIPLYIFGYHYRVLQYFSILLLVPATLFTYLLTSQLTNNKKWAVFTSSLFILFPVVWEQSRYWMLDLPLTVFVLGSTYFLLISDKYRKIWPLVISVVLAGFAQMTKWYGAVFLVVPFLYIFIQSWSVHKDKWRFLLKTLLLLLIPLLIVLPWYGVNLRQLIQDTLFFSHSHYQNPTDTFTLKNFFYYPILMLNFQIVSISFLWMVISLILFVRSKIEIKKLILMQIGFCMLVFTLLGNKNVRFLMPLLPFFAILMGYGLIWVYEKSKVAAYSIWSGLILFGLMFMSVNSFGFPFKFDQRCFSAPIKDWDILIWLDGKSDIIPYHYIETNWSAKSIIEDIKKQGDYENADVMIGINNDDLSQPVIEVFKFESNEPINFSTPPFDVRETIESEDEILGYLDKFEYLLIPKDNVGPAHHVNYHNLENIQVFVMSGETRDYQWINSYPIPDGETVYLFKKNVLYNELTVRLEENALFVSRPDVPTQVYLQVMDVDFNWEQYHLDLHQKDFYLDLSDIKTIRIDYPSYLWEINLGDEWEYDGDMQLNRLSEEDEENNVN